MIRSLFALLLLVSLSGCAAISVSATRNLSLAILDQTDPETVEAGAPAYLLLVDSLIRSDPNDEDLLVTGSKLYGAYAGVFVKDPARAQRLTAHAREYAQRALCAWRSKLCGLADRPFEQYQSALAGMQKKDVPFLYTFASAWAGWIQARSGDWVAIADLPKVQAAMQRVVDLDEGHEQGNAHLYLGVMNTFLPPTLGGKPEQGRMHFERAIALSRGQDLMIKVEFARRYARLVFDRELHDRLLQEVLNAPVNAPQLTLSNTLAHRAARELLKSADSFF